MSLNDLLARLWASVVALFLGVFCLSMALPASAQIFEQCSPRSDAWHFKPTDESKAAARQREEARCTAENAVYAAWSAKLDKFNDTRQELSQAANAGNAEVFSKAIVDAKELMLELQAAAIQNPKVAGSESIRSMLGPDLNYFFQNAGLSAPSSLEDAFSKIEAAVSNGEEHKAATLVGTLLSQASSRGTHFVIGLGREASQNVLLETVEIEKVENALKLEQQRGSSVSGYFGGFGARVGLFRGFVIEWTVIATVIAAFFAFGAKRPRVAVKMPIIAAAVLTPAWLVNVFFPFIPGWLLFVVIFFVGVWLWHMTEKLPAPYSNVFNTTKVGRPSAGDFAGAMLRAFAAGKGGIVAEVSTAAPTADSKNTHGSARWGTPDEMQEKGHLLPPGKQSGFALARVPNAPAGFDQRFQHVGHVVTVAPTGAGKGIGAVIPHLLSYPGSSLVLDVKGENAAVTARARRELGHKVFIVDPFGVTGGESHSFNLLDRLDPTDPECVSESAVLADSLVIADPQGQTHFDESARTLLQGLMLHVAGLDEGQRNLPEVRRILTAGEDTLLGTMAEMAADEQAAFGLPARAANTIMGMADRERGSVISTAQKSTAFMDDPRISAALSRSDFDLSNIKDELMTVYLVMPANKIGPNARFVRGFVGSIISAITSSAKQPPYRVAFLLDEFGQLGYMKVIEDAVSLLRGYGLSFWVFIQDLSQLKGVYPKWQTFLANSAKTFYGTDDYDTAKYISDSLGQSTIEYETHNEGKNTGSGLSGGGGSMNRGKSAGQSQQFTARSLLTPDEVMRLGPEQPIVLVKGEFPYVLRRLNYLTDAEYVGRADANPYHS